MDDRRPNILFVFTDEQRWDWLGGVGVVPVRTPHLDALAARGVRFDRCRCNTPMCAPSRASLATGLRYHRVGVPDNTHDLDLRHPTFMQSLRVAGYRVAVVGKTDLAKKSRPLSVNGWTSHHGRLGFTDADDQAGKRDGALFLGEHEPAEPYTAFLHERGVAREVLEDVRCRTEIEKREKLIDASPFPLPREYEIDDFVGRRTLEMLDRLPPDQPWFCQVNMGGPHPPWDASAELLARYEDVDFPSPVGDADDRNDHQAVRRSYAAMIDGIDEWVGRFLRRLDERGELERTLVVFSSDHGEMLGDHGLWLKGRPHEGSARIPLIVAGPGVAPGRVSNANVELTDLAATFVDRAEAMPPDDWDARSLTSVLRGERDDHRDVCVTAFGGWRTACDGRWKLTAEGDAATLFDLERDPHELDNVIDQAPSEAARLRDALTAAYGE